MGIFFEKDIVWKISAVPGVALIHSMSAIMIKSGEDPCMMIEFFSNSSPLSERRQDSHGSPFSVNAKIIGSYFITGISRK